MKADFEINGMDVFEKNTEKLADSISHKNMGGSLFKRAEMLRDRIRDKAPLGPTGNLKRSPMAKLMPERRNFPAVAIAGIDRVIAPHAHLIEFGTSRAPAYPFLRPAVDEMKESILKGVEADAKKKIEGAV